MTRIFIKFMALFAAIIMIVGCEKDNDRFEKEGGLQTLTVAALSGNADTKVNITPNEEGDALGFKVKWEVGDKLHASSADGNTHIATFEIKAADDIAADGSAKFTAVEGTTTLLELGTSYKFHHAYDEVYNEATGISPYDNYHDEAFNKNNLMHSILHTESATTINNAITLSHLLSYIELTVDVADKSAATVRFKYTDKNTDKEFVHRYELANWDGVADGTKYTFNFPIYPASLTAEKPVTVELSNDYGSSYTEQFRIASDDDFRAGMHYRIKDPATELLLANISATNIPVGDTWTIEDTDATAGDAEKFAGLIAAIEALESSRSVDIVFPNLTTLPASALFGCEAKAKWTFSAPEVTTVGGMAFFSADNITKIEMPKATSIAYGLCNAESLVALTIAKEARVTSTHENTFMSMTCGNIDLITNSSNISDLKFKLVDNTLVGPFKSVNGATTPGGFPDDAVAVMKKTSGTLTIPYEIDESGIEINEDNRGDLSNMKFIIGYNKRKLSSSARFYIYDTFEDVTWTSTGWMYLDVINNGNGIITLTLDDDKELPLVPQTVTITAKAPNGVEMSFKVNLKGNVAPTSVKLDRDLFVANIGAEMTLSATVSPATATNKDITWTSSDKTVATVDDNGKVTTKEYGETIITATTKDGAKTATCTVKVNGTDYAAKQYQVGDYYPDEYTPVGVVFKIDGAISISSSGSSGKVISLDEFTGKFSIINDASVTTLDWDGYHNMGLFYKKDNDFSSYPAFKWVAEKNTAGYSYPSGTKVNDQWYIASEKELEDLESGYNSFSLTEFNKKITDAGGKPITTSDKILSSTINNSNVYVLNTANGSIESVSKSSETTKVRAIMSFHFEQEQY